MRRLEKILAQTEWVLCHNSFYPDNFLIDESHNVYLMNLKFSQFNYIGFDLGNFLNEWAAFNNQGNHDIRDESEMSETLKDKLTKTYFDVLKKSYVFNTTEQDLKIYVELGRVMSHMFWIIINLKQLNQTNGTQLIDCINSRCSQLQKHFNIVDRLSNI
jgi:thiamine kinase-like enzyme